MSKRYPSSRALRLSGRGQQRSTYEIVASAPSASRRSALASSLRPSRRPLPPPPAAAPPAAAAAPAATPAAPAAPPASGRKTTAADGQQEWFSIAAAGKSPTP